MINEHEISSATASRYNEDLVALINRQFADSGTISIADVNAGKFPVIQSLAPQIRADQIWLLIVQEEDKVIPIRESLAGWAQRNGWHFVPEQEEYFSINSGRFTWRCGIRVIPQQEVLEQLNFSSIRLVTASRYLEYRTEKWLQELLNTCTDTSTAMYFIRNYSGHLEWIPSDFKDATILAAWHRAQRKFVGEKNSILADRAGYVFMDSLSDKKYQAFQNKYHQQFGKNEESFILKQILAMEKEVAGVIKEDSKETLERWLSRKRYTVSGGKTKLEMGLTDVLALPQL